MIIDHEHPLSPSAAAAADRIADAVAALADDHDALEDGTLHPSADGADLVLVGSHPLRPISLHCALATGPDGEITAARWEIHDGIDTRETSEGWVPCSAETALRIFEDGARTLSGIAPGPFLTDQPMTPTELRLIRASHGLSAADLAYHLDVGERTLRRWEAGGSPIPDGAAAQVRGLEQTVDTIADDFRRAMQTALKHGLWTVEVPVSQDGLPDWARPDIPLALWEAGAARATEQFGVRLTSIRDMR